MKDLKKIFGLMCLLVLALTSVALTSCSNDDDDSNNDGGSLAVSYKGETYYTNESGYWDRKRVSITVAPKDDMMDYRYFNIIFDEDLTSSGTLTNVEAEVKGEGFGYDYDKLTSGSVEAKVNGGNITLIFHNAEFANGVKANGSVAITKAYAN